MAKARILTTLFIFALLLGCSHPNPKWTIQIPQNNIAAQNGEATDSISTTADDSTALSGSDIDEALDNAENYYAVGVHYFQVSMIDSAQAAYEQSLNILSDLDLDPEQNPEQAARMERLLNEIEEDYRLTLMSSGTLSSEASITAFRELFSDLKNFKKLKESATLTEFNKADSIIYDIDIEWNDRVENSLIYLQTVARDKFNDYLARSGAYLPIMEKIFKEKGLPHDLVYLPLIESGFKATAYSYARASGFWQFISATGKLYGLDHNWYFDERRDFEKSTEAAANHLKDLYDIFGDWNLALAAYNAGAGRVNREIKRSHTNNFWKLNLAKQTKNYVPLFMAATIIAKQPNKYGFFPEYESPLEYKKVKTNKCISFENIRAKTGISIADLERLNPELLRGITPPGDNDYALRIPVGYEDVFASAYDEIPSEKITTWARHRVRKGETLSGIARKYGVSVSSIVQANDIGRKKRIYAGQVLTVPFRVGRYSGSDATTVASKNRGNSGQTSSKKQPVVAGSSGRYMVKDGDTLWEIAVAHGVSISDLKRLNNLSSNRIFTGRWLKVPERESNPDEVQPTRATYEIYTVRRGDNLSKLARRYGLSVRELMKLNGLSSTRLYVGMSLKVPASSSSNSRYVSDKRSSARSLDRKVYTVKRGDTLWKIAKSHGVDVGDLLKWNNITRQNRLLPGDKLKIYL
jgi:membrane-bound lytic murein transglycosylase D